MTSVPFSTEYWANGVEWGGYNGTKAAALIVSDPPYGQDPLLTLIYYDMEYCGYKIKDHAGGGSFDQWIADCYSNYRNYYVVPAGGGVQGFRNFTEGFYEDVARATVRAVNAKAAIQSILDNSNFVRSDNLSDDLLSRECAYALMAIINGTRAGCTIDATVTARIPVLLGWCLGHIDQWCTLLTADYYRPFMGGITAHALVHYFTHVSEDSRIVPALIVLEAYTTSTCWKAAAGAWGQGKSFLYTDRFVVDSADTETAPDLNMMICPMWGFLYHQTGTQSYRDMGDLIFEGAISVYDGDGFYQSGAYLGTRSASNPSGKQYDQQFIWGTKYIEYAEATPLGEGGSDTPRSGMLMGVGG